MGEYYFEIEGITEETLEEFIAICKRKDLMYTVDGNIYNDFEGKEGHYE